MTGPADDLARLAALLGLRIPREDLERLTPAVQAVYAGLERLRSLPLEDREPAFAPPRGGDPGSAGEP